MDPITFESYIRNPDVKRALLERAHRERAAVVHRLIVEPITSLFRAKPRAAGAHLPAAR